jgi:hypothetical protein
LADLRNEIVSIDMECWQLDGSILDKQLSEEEYGELLRVRKSSDYPPKPSEAWDSWSELVCRHWRQNSDSAERESWHEAGHVVVGYRMGWDIERIDRHVNGWPRAIIPPPCLPPELPLLDLTTITVAGYLAEQKALGNAVPTDEVAEMARHFMDASGGKATVWDRINFVQKAETRALPILNEDWAAVRRVAKLAMNALPVEREALLEALSGVEKGSPPCGPGIETDSPKGAR